MDRKVDIIIYAPETHIISHLGSIKGIITSVEIKPEGVCYHASVIQNGELVTKEFYDFEFVAVTPDEAQMKRVGFTFMK